ncbi:HNH endonuclease [Streptomyces omiyaensis]|uniref:HNH endonuclease n=1 Tax=Streptomyces omiyaensis TaxID=68247 RepID=UPI0016795E1E|nr:HNH endonuclease signature motif containing protein [Streptomyces omiyaensis]
MRCIDCTELATHRGRCKTHHAVYEGRPAIEARGRRRAARNDAAARLHRVIERKGFAWCDRCLNDFPTVDVYVDHVRPLSRGGTDTDGNVQVLCRGCHRLKTATEFGGAA